MLRKQLGFGLLVLWLVLTIGISFTVARISTRDTVDEDLMEPRAPISTADRSTVSLESRIIASVFSSQGTVVRDESGSRWLLVAPIQPSELAYKLIDPPFQVKALIDGGPAGFDCLWLGLNPLADVASVSEAGGSATMGCVIPSNIRVVTGLTGTMAVTMTQPVERSVLPASAVIGQAQQGQVIVIGEDGQLSVRPIEIGTTDGVWIEIVSGVSENERVLEFPTQSDFQASSQ